VRSGHAAEPLPSPRSGRGRLRGAGRRRSVLESQARRGAPRRLLPPSSRREAPRGLSAAADAAAPRPRRARAAQAPEPGRQPASGGPVHGGRGAPAD
jgi:hypothetical protein